MKIFYYFNIFISFFFINCYSKIGDFSVVSTRNSNITKWEKFPQRVIGRSCTNILLFIPISVRNLKDAIDDSIDKSNKESRVSNESLLDVKIYRYWWSLILYTRSCYEVEGIPANSWNNKNYYN